MMVEEQVERRGVKDARVLAAMRAVPRHDFLPENEREHAYEDRPVPIGAGQTISQPYIVALMTELAGIGAEDKVLEVGTGSGYQAAVLAAMTPHVFTIEIVPELHRRAREVLLRQGWAEERMRLGDGYGGWPEEAPFDAIVVTAAPDHVPPALVEQLAPGGRLVIPVGPQGALQHLLVVEKDAQGSVTERRVLPVRFVPLTREGE